MGPSAAAAAAAAAAAEAAAAVAALWRLEASWVAAADHGSAAGGGRARDVGGCGNGQRASASGSAACRACCTQLVRLPPATLLLLLSGVRGCLRTASHRIAIRAWALNYKKNSCMGTNRSFS